MREGLNPRNIVVVQNLIVDVLEHYYFDRKDEYDALRLRRVLRRRAALERDEST